MFSKSPKPGEPPIETAMLTKESRTPVILELQDIILYDCPGFYKFISTHTKSVKSIYIYIYIYV